MMLIKKDGFLGGELFQFYTLACYVVMMKNINIDSWGRGYYCIVLTAVLTFEKKGRVFRHLFAFLANLDRFNWSILKELCYSCELLLSSVLLSNQVFVSSITFEENPCLSELVFLFWRSIILPTALFLASQGFRQRWRHHERDSVALSCCPEVSCSTIHWWEGDLKVEKKKL